MNIRNLFGKKQVRLSLILALILAGLLLWSAELAQAQEKDTSVFLAWDSKQYKYQNSMVLANVNQTPTGVWVPFLHHLDFDTNPYAPSSCSAGAKKTTQYAGLAYLGLFHEDNAPAGAVAFTQSRDWRIVKCDRDSDGLFANGDLYMQPPTAVTTWEPLTPDHLKVLSQDTVTPCTTGNCQNEIVTTVEINLDLDCDGVIDAPIPDGGLCFYAEGFLSSSVATDWKGPIQARFTDVAGDKTVNFDPWLGPNAVKLMSLTVKSPLAFSGALMMSLGIILAVGMVISSRKQSK